MHTSGPWTVEPDMGADCGRYYIKEAAERQEAVTKETWDETWAEDRANAVLIAAAPDMLDVIEQIIDDYDDSGDMRYLDESINAAREVLTKAKPAGKE